MTLSESEITEYGDPLWNLRTTADGPDLIHQIGYCANYERLHNASECGIDCVGPCPLMWSMSVDWSLPYYSIVFDVASNPMETEDAKPSNVCLCS